MEKKFKKYLSKVQAPSSNLLLPRNLEAKKGYITCFLNQPVTKEAFCNTNTRAQEADELSSSDYF